MKRRDERGTVKDDHREKAEISGTALKKKKLIEEKHRQIALGASRVLLKKGYHPTTIREIAEACDMSMGQLYRYISSKDDVLFFVFEYMNTIWFEHMQHSNIDEAEDPVERLRNALRSTLEFSVKNKRLIQFIFTESKYLDRRHLRAVLKMDYDVILSYWQELLSDVYKFKCIKADVKFAANMVDHVITFLPLRGWTVGDRPLEQSIESLIDFVFGGIGISGG